MDDHLPADIFDGVPGLPPLPAGQWQILNCIKLFFLEHGYWPSVRDLAAMVGGVHPNSVQGMLRALRRKGYIEQPPRTPRAFRIAGFKVQLIRCPTTASSTPTSAPASGS